MGKEAERAKDVQSMLEHTTRSLCSAFKKRTDTTLSVKRGIFPKAQIVFPRFTAIFERELSGECVITTDGSGTPQITHKGSTGPLSEHARVTGNEDVPRLIQYAAEQTHESDIAA